MTNPQERDLKEAFKVLLSNHYWVEGPAEGGEQNLYRTDLEEGKFIGKRIFVCQLSSAQAKEALLEAAEVVKTIAKLRNGSTQEPASTDPI